MHPAGRTCKCCLVLLEYYLLLRAADFAQEVVPANLCKSLDAKFLVAVKIIFT